MRAKESSRKKADKELIRQYKSLDDALKAKREIAIEQNKAVRLPESWLHKA